MGVYHSMKIMFLKLAVYFILLSHKDNVITHKDQVGGKMYNKIVVCNYYVILHVTANVG